MNDLDLQEAKLAKDLLDMMKENDSFEQLEVIERSAKADFWTCVDLQIEVHELENKQCLADEGLLEKYSIRGIDDEQDLDPNMSFI